jgi:AcrR family transcriptional regulator
MPDDTKQRILHSAFLEFAQHGKAGARMQAIAERAGTNQAMLNYYFTSKDELYLEVIRHGAEEVRDAVLCSRFDERMDVRQLIAYLVERYIRYWAEHTDSLRLMLRDLLAGGEGMKSAFKASLCDPETDKMMQKIGEDPIMRQRDPRQIHLHFTALTMFFFLQVPIMDALWPPPADEDFVKARIEAVQDLLLHGLFHDVQAT